MLGENKFGNISVVMWIVYKIQKLSTQWKSHWVMVYNEPRKLANLSATMRS